MKDCRAEPARYRRHRTRKTVNRPEPRGPKPRQREASRSGQSAGGSLGAAVVRAEISEGCAPVSSKICGEGVWQHCPFCGRASAHRPRAEIAAAHKAMHGRAWPAARAAVQAALELLGGASSQPRSIDRAILMIKRWFGRRGLDVVHLAGAGRRSSSLARAFAHQYVHVAGDAAASKINGAARMLLERAAAWLTAADEAEALRRMIATERRTPGEAPRLGNLTGRLTRRCDAYTPRGEAMQGREVSPGHGRPGRSARSQGR